MQILEDDVMEDAASEATAEAERAGRSSKRRRRGSGFRARPAARVARELLLERANFLAEPARTMVHAHYALGMPVEEIAHLHKSTARQIRRRIKRLRETLSDPCFLLAARFSSRLPVELAQLVKDHWIGGQSLRELAAAGGMTLHRVRHDIGVARSLLVVAMSEDQAVPRELARAAIDSRRGA